MDLTPRYTYPAKQYLAPSRLTLRIPESARPSMYTDEPLNGAPATGGVRPSISMPDHTEYTSPIIARRNANGGLLQSQVGPRPPPYPVHDQDFDTSGMGPQHGFNSFYRQATADDFLRPQHPLPAPPVEVYDSDQELPVIETDSYLHEDQLNEPGAYNAIEFNTSNAAALGRCQSVFNAESNHMLLLAPAHQHSETVTSGGLYVSSPLLEPMMSEPAGAVVRVQSMDSDMYQPALGGLHNISGIKRKDSKRDRVKRFCQDMNLFRRRREFGRASRGSIN
ncbi:hypothetical protein EJ02DRAFT_420399 [Clathrospora elynae]|uniref:Uncharacterized protein n=1 Tax=Clathrospora elynae TaxID=706981 RepID=A0A6A5SWV1_9PLEO|nr:hypothetical protein EJ02DRAFT_420399 [Clathrospora elynae]